MHNPGSDGDTPALPDLSDQIPEDEEIGIVTADGAHAPGLRPFGTELIHWTNSGTPFTPPLSDGDHRPTGYSYHSDPQEWTTLERGLQDRNGQEPGTMAGAFRKLWNGYHARSRIEAEMRRLKAFGDGIAARDPGRRTAEIQNRAALMDRFSALGTAEIVRVG